MGGWVMCVYVCVCCVCSVMVVIGHAAVYSMYLYCIWTSITAVYLYEYVYIHIYDHCSVFVAEANLCQDRFKPCSYTWIHIHIHLNPILHVNPNLNLCVYAGMRLPKVYWTLYHHEPKSCSYIDAYAYPFTSLYLNPNPILNLNPKSEPKSLCMSSHGAPQSVSKSRPSQTQVVSLLWSTLLQR